MNLSDKILRLRKDNKMSQEELAEKLNVSRQAISRWEMATAQPDAVNVLQLSKIFNVTTDYLLNDEYENDKDIPIVKEIEKTNKAENNTLITFIVLIGLNIMVFIYQIIANFIIYSDLFTLTGTIINIAVIIGFEVGYRKTNTKTKSSIKYYKLFYKITFCLASYFPIKILIKALSTFYPRAYLVVVRDIIIFAIYVISSIVVWKIIDRKNIEV